MDASPFAAFGHNKKPRAGWHGAFRSSRKSRFRGACTGEVQAIREMIEEQSITLLCGSSVGEQDCDKMTRSGVLGKHP